MADERPTVKKIVGKKGGKGGRTGQHSKGRRFDIKTLKRPSQQRIDKLLKSEGIYQTYFAAEGGGLKEGHSYLGYDAGKGGGQFTDGFYSNNANLLAKQLWRQAEPYTKINGPLGEAGIEFGGKVPFEVLINKLNEVLNLNGDGTDFRTAFNYWSYRYEVSYSVKTETGLYNVIVESFGDESSTPKPNFGYEKFIKG